MKLTSEQIAIISSNENIKINAVAGSGKTTTVIEYAKTRPKNSKILYIVFNKSVKLESAIKFQKIGLNNVKVETAHALAYKYIVFSNKYSVKANGYKTNELAQLLLLKGNEEKHTEYVIANHVNKFATYFCNSDKSKVQDLNYLDVVFDLKAKIFVKTFYPYIESQTRLFLSKMDKAEIEITHDFYLKKFQLSNPTLPFDYILFDEGQDASPAMLDIFLKQPAIKVIVGDTHQQIYGWRFAVNSLEKVNFKNFNLTSSFRFGPDIASLAMQTLQLKDFEDDFENPVLIKGEGKSNEMVTKAVIGRTNLGLLLKAIAYITEKKKVKHIYFEGNIHSYTYADEGASLYDILNLYLSKKHLIRDPLIKIMADMNELKEYVKKTEDAQLSMMIDIVEEYGEEIPEIIKEIKEKHVSDDDKHKAEMIFSTVHRCKGMEYDAIHIVEDFITKEKLDKFGMLRDLDDIQISKINEEINLLYVAITRAKNKIYIPETLLHFDFKETSNIHILKVKKQEENNETYENYSSQTDIIKETKETGEEVKERIKKDFKEAYNAWTEAMDQELTTKYYDGINSKTLAQHFGRTQGAIKSRIKKLKLNEL